MKIKAVVIALSIIEAEFVAYITFEILMVHLIACTCDCCDWFQSNDTRTTIVF